MTEVVAREAARVLLLDADDRVLMFQGCDPAAADRGTWWFTPGGGLDAGETSGEAAVRELREETGLVVSVEELGPIVHRRTTTFPWGDEVYQQTEDYFSLRVHAHDVDTSGFNELETRAVLGHRWWRREELAASGERYYPQELLELLG